MINPDVISFFVLIFFLSSILISVLWNITFHKTEVPTMKIRTGMNAAAAWACFSTAFLVFLEMTRNFLSPGLWKSELLFTGLKQETMPTGHSILTDFLLGWYYFPKRILTEVTFHPAAIWTGLVILLVVLVLVQVIGWLIARSKWQFRWGLTFPAAFILLYVISYTAVGLVRQVGWMIFT